MVNKNVKLIYYLKNIYGISDFKARKLIIYIGATPNIIYKNLLNHKKDSLNKVLNFYNKSRESNALGKNLKKFQKEQIDRSIFNNSLKGRKRKLKLPVRGQRTSSNARTAKKKTFKL